MDGMPGSSRRQFGGADSAGSAGCSSDEAHTVTIRPDRTPHGMVRDDPLAAKRGTPAERRLYAAILVLVWEAIGYKLAYAKSQLERIVTWIGGTLTINAKRVKAVAKESIVEDMLFYLVRVMA